MPYNTMMYEYMGHHIPEQVRLTGMVIDHDILEPEKEYTGVHVTMLKDDKIIDEFDTLSEAVKVTGFTMTRVRNNLMGKTKDVDGFVFKSRDSKDGHLIKSQYVPKRRVE